MRLISQLEDAIKKHATKEQQLSTAVISAEDLAEAVKLAEAIGRPSYHELITSDDPIKIITAGVLYAQSLDGQVDISSIAHHPKMWRDLQTDLLEPDRIAAQHIQDHLRKLLDDKSILVASRCAPSSMLQEKRVKVAHVDSWCKPSNVGTTKSSHGILPLNQAMELRNLQYDSYISNDCPNGAPQGLCLL